MGIFKNKNTKKEPKSEVENTKDKFPDYVDSLLCETSEEQMLDFEREPLHQRTRYGIEQAIELITKLPSDNETLVVSVVTQTLDSANIDIQTIIEDANKKESNLSECISVKTDEIDQLEKMINEKKEDIDTAQQALSKIEKVKALLLNHVDLKHAMKPSTKLSKEEQKPSMNNIKSVTTKDLSNTISKKPTSQSIGSDQALHIAVNT